MQIDLYIYPILCYNVKISYIKNTTETVGIDVTFVIVVSIRLSYIGFSVNLAIKTTGNAAQSRALIHIFTGVKVIH